MKLRKEGCLECAKSTGGDCGQHGPLAFKGKIVASERPPLVMIDAGPVDEPEPVDQGPETPLFHMVCSVNPDHVVYVLRGAGHPPTPVSCPWRCGWLNMKREVSAFGL